MPGGASRSGRRGKQHERDAFSMMTDPLKNNPGFGDMFKDSMARQQRYQPVTALINSLPIDGEWTEEERDQWIAAVYSTVDYLVKVREK